jgi:hypothetical protein
MTTRLAAVAAALLMLLGLGTSSASATSVLMIWTNPHSITSLTAANHYLAGTPLGFRRKMGSFGHHLASMSECAGVGVFVERFDSRGFASTRTSCGDDAGQVWVRASGIWKVVTHWDRGQNISCGALRHWGVPSLVLDSQPAYCQNSLGDNVPYSHA